MVRQELWDKTAVMCLVGNLIDPHTFKDCGSQMEYDCTSYKKLHREIQSDRLICVNLKWKAEPINAWVIFQYVLME